jgi:antitoxin (DNA-binding transcriptional repressor) of toxin-antitoxin stability system
MKASVVDLRRNMKQVIKALDRNETVILLYRGKEKARIVPTAGPKPSLAKMRAHPAFGMWKDRQDMADPSEYVRAMRTRKRYAL